MEKDKNNWSSYTIKQMKRSKLYENLPPEYKKSQYKKVQDLANVLNIAMKDEKIPKEYRIIEFRTTKKNESKPQNLTPPSSPTNKSPSSPIQPPSPKRKSAPIKYNIQIDLKQDIKNPLLSSQTDSYVTYK